MQFTALIARLSYGHELRNNCRDAENDLLTPRQPLSKGPDFLESEGEMQGGETGKGGLGAAAFASPCLGLQTGWDLYSNHCLQN